GASACQTTGIEDSLAAIEGEFVQRPEGVFYSHNSALADAVKSGEHEKLPEQTLLALANCMKNERAAKSTYRGNPVPLSLVCYQAIGNFAYYEKTDETGDIVSWPGYVDLPASQEAFRQAGEAWKEVIEARVYLWH
ncbi:MAG: hypothetical protein LBI68_04910, partial [Azoarcus sp.]|nr:hypothetical protein [Azoarcus sp.]